MSNYYCYRITCVHYLGPTVRYPNVSSNQLVISFRQHVLVACYFCSRSLQHHRSIPPFRETDDTPNRKKSQHTSATSYVAGKLDFPQDFLLYGWGSENCPHREWVFPRNCLTIEEIRTGTKRFNQTFYFHQGKYGTYF